MGAVVDWFGTGVATVIGWTVVHSLGQGALLACALALMLRIVPGTMTRLRSAFASGALALMLGLVVAVWLGLTADWRQHEACWQSTGFAGEHPATCASHGVSPPAGVKIDRDSKPRAVLSWAWLSPGPAPMGERAGPLALTATPVMGLVGLAAGLLATLSFLWLLVDLYLLRGILRRSRRVDDPHILEIFGRLRERMRIRVPVDLRDSIDVATPAVAGLLPPVVLLPRGMSAALAAEDVECILAHELVHIRRGHFAVNLAQRALECLFVWNPFALWISRRIRDEREALCDAAVAGRPAGDRRRYGETLLRLEHLRTPTRSALIGMLGGGPLLRRIRRLAEVEAPDRLTCLRRAGTAVLAAMATLLLVVQVSISSMAISSWALMEVDLVRRVQAGGAAPLGGNQPLEAQVDETIAERR